MEFVKYIVIFILLYNFESIISALANLIIESMNWIIGIIALDLNKRQCKAESETQEKEELTPCIGFQVDSSEDDLNYD